MLDLITMSENATATLPGWAESAVSRIEGQLVERYGKAQRERARRGMHQALQFWREPDGTEQEFEGFVLENFAGSEEALSAMFTRFEALLEQLDGHLHEVRREFRQQLDLDLGPVQPYDQIFGGYDPSAHVQEDFFENKLAFVVLLNFPLTSLQERLTQGKKWSRQEWAEARLAQRFDRRVPAEVSLAMARTDAETSRYVSEYNIWMRHLVNEHGERMFPAGMRLISHWGLRDEIKAEYVQGAAALPKQRMIQKVMERVISQTIPACVVNNPGVDWDPFTNQVSRASEQDASADDIRSEDASAEREPDMRYAMLLKTFAASQKLDRFSPTAPTLIARRFEEDREIPEQRVREMLEQVLNSPAGPKLAAVIEKRLGRKLEPFDIWYNGFAVDKGLNEKELDAMVVKRYPTAEAFHRDMPSILRKLGFSKQRADELSDAIVVDPGRGAGHAWGAAMRAGKAHLRTRVEKTGMNFRGFNVAMHELGHNVEQTLSLRDVDHTLLNGVPNTAFTEAFAFLFQGKDMEVLGLSAPSAKARAGKALNDFWATREIAGVALVDMATWRWMYEHPVAKAGELKEAVLGIAKDLWNRFYAPIFGRKDEILLAVYSHIIDGFMYLPDYPIGHLISHQIEEQMEKAGSIGGEFERMAKMGRVSPDLWMEEATGRPVGAEALLHAAEAALANMS
jgi:hypothetical protein